MLKNDDYRSVRSLRLTDFTWQALGAAAEALLITRADLLEQMFRAEYLRGSIPSPDLISNGYIIPGNAPQNGSIQACTTEIKVDCQPCITRSDEEIRLKAEIQYLRQQNTWLREQSPVGLSVVPLEVLRDRVLKNLKLGKQAPKYKAIQKALEHFITLITTQQSS